MFLLFAYLVFDQTTSSKVPFLALHEDAITRKGMGPSNESIDPKD